MPCKECKKKNICKHCDEVLKLTATLHDTVKFNATPIQLNVSCKYKVDETEDRVSLYPISNRRGRG